MCINGAIFEYEDEQDYLMKNSKSLEAWGFDMDALRESEGAFSSLDRRSPRAFSTNVSNESTKPTYKWDHYSGLPGPEAYIG